MSKNAEKQETFLNGWLGERFAEQWLHDHGWENIETGVMMSRGGSSGDIDITAKKGRKRLVAEVKFWSTVKITPSWIFQFMLGRNKLNSLFEKYPNVSDYILFMYKHPEGTFRYERSENCEYIKNAKNSCDIPRKIIKGLDGKSYRDFLYEIIQYKMNKKHRDKKFNFQIKYFKEFKEDFDLSLLKGKIREQLVKDFDKIYYEHVEN